MGSAVRSESLKQTITEVWRMSTRRTIKIGAVFYVLALGIQCGRVREGSLEPNAGSFFFPTTGVAVEKQALLLAIDDYLLPLRENVSYSLTKPNVHKEPVLRPSRDNPASPDSVAAHFYGTVLQDGGKFRMWYYACHLAKPADVAKADLSILRQGPVCYA